MNNLRECAEYFRERKEYDRLFLEMKKKWKSLGRASGIIVVKDATEAERRAAGGITGKVFTGKDLKVFFADFERGLQKTRFAPVDIKELLEEYFGEEILTNKETAEAKGRKLADFFNEMRSYSGGKVRWIDEMAETKKAGYAITVREFEKDPGRAAGYVKNVIDALAGLDEMEEDVPLAVFAAGITGNPHCFDKGTVQGQLLIHGICSEKGMEMPSDARSWRRLLDECGISPDGISSMIHAAGLRLGNENGWHPAWEAFCKAGEPSVVTMENLKGITKAAALGGRAYIVENEMVFSYLAGAVKGKNVTVLCTCGQFRAAAYEVIQMLAERGTDIFYSGDTDPEGIDMADRLWRKFGDCVKIWRMSPADYYGSISGEEVSTLAKCDNVSHPVLKETAVCLKKEKKAGYQENILDKLLDDIK